jgi:hypothetical protein
MRAARHCQQRQSCQRKQKEMLSASVGVMFCFHRLSFHVGSIRWAMRNSKTLRAAAFGRMLRNQYREPDTITFRVISSA